MGATKNLNIFFSGSVYCSKICLNRTFLFERSFMSEQQSLSNLKPEEFSEVLHLADNILYFYSATQVVIKVRDWCCIFPTTSYPGRIAIPKEPNDQHKQKWELDAIITVGMELIHLQWTLNDYFQFRKEEFHPTKMKTREQP
jgi:hypothetical protein